MLVSCVGEPSAPKLEANVADEGNSLRVTWIKQDDGGLPIIHYLVKYKAVSKEYHLHQFLNHFYIT